MISIASSTIGRDSWGRSETAPDRSHAAGAKADIQPAFGKMVQKCQPTRDVGRVMLLQADRRGAQANAPRLAQRGR